MQETSHFSNEELVLMIQAGDRDRLIDLWHQIERWVYKVAHRWAALGERAGATWEDFTQCGWIAMLEAVATWSPSEETRFTTWLTFHLKRNFGNAARVHGGVQKYDPMNQNPRSLEEPLGDEDDNLTLANALPDPSAEQAILTIEEHDALYRAIGQLSELEQEALYLKFWEERTQEESALILGIPKNEVVKLETSALRFLRNPARSRDLRELLV